MKAHPGGNISAFSLQRAVAGVQDVMRRQGAGPLSNETASPSTGWVMEMTAADATGSDGEVVAVGQLSLRIQRLEPADFRAALEAVIRTLEVEGESEAEAEPQSETASETASETKSETGMGPKGPPILTQFVLAQDLDPEALSVLLAQMHRATCSITQGMLVRVGVLSAQWLARTGHSDTTEPGLAHYLNHNGLKQADQGIYALEQADPCRHESLARFMDTGGVVHSAGKVLTGGEPWALLARLDRTMLSTAVDRLHADAHLQLSINVCRSTLADQGWLSILHDRIMTHADALARLVFEITEWPLQAQDAPLSQALSPLTALGLDIWLDDFGAGLTSFNEAVVPGITGLKIDRSLLRSAWLDNDAFGTLGTITGFARRLGKTCVIEGVETLDERRFAESCGASHVQGFFSGRV